MYSQFTISAPLVSTSMQGSHKCLVLGNWLLLLSCVVVLNSIAISFVFEDSFSITTQVFAHMATIVFAGVLKIGYVLRCIGLKGLGERV